MPRDEVPPDNPNPDAGSIPGFHSGLWQKGPDSGKILKDDIEPDISTHLHKHKDGITLSTYRGGVPVERFNLDTGMDESPEQGPGSGPSGYPTPR